VATIAVATTEFEELAVQSAARSGLVRPRIAVVEHPVGGLLEPQLDERSRSMVDEIIALFTTSS